MKPAFPNPDELPDELFEKINLTREQFKEIHAMMRERDAKTPAVGTEAPDFEIERLSAKGARTGENFRLSSLRGRPVALVFGSYT
jgi:hypothetical protein